MKRASILMAIITMIGLGSCTTFSRKTKLKTDIDTISFYVGMARANDINNYLVFQSGIDTAYMDAFYKGFKEGAKRFSPEDVAYYEGMHIAQMISNQWVESMNQDLFMGDSGRTVNRFAMLSGSYYGLKNLDEESSIQIQTHAQVLLERLKDEYRKEKYADLIAAGEKILADNSKKPEIHTTESGLQYKIITEGTGAIPNDRDIVKVNYRGTLADGTEFDSSYKNNEPASLYVGGVVRGWTEALMKMPVGSKWELYIPSNLGYGITGQPPTIPPYATLIFEVELLDIQVK